METEGFGESEVARAIYPFWDKKRAPLSGVIITEPLWTISDWMVTLRRWSAKVQCFVCSHACMDQRMRKAWEPAGCKAACCMHLILYMANLGQAQGLMHGVSSGGVDEGGERRASDAVSWSSNIVHDTSVPLRIPLVSVPKFPFFHDEL